MSAGEGDRAEKRRTVDLTLIEPHEHTHYASDEQEEPEEVELSDVLPQGLVVTQRVEVESEEEEGEGDASSWSARRCQLMSSSEMS